MGRQDSKLRCLIFIRLQEIIKLFVPIWSLCTEDEIFVWVIYRNIGSWCTVNVSKILEVRLIIAFCDLVIRRKSEWWTSWRDGGDTSIHHGSTCMNRNQTVTNVIWRISNMILLILQKFQYTVGKTIRDLGFIHSIVDGFGLYLYEPSSDCYWRH